MALSVTSSMGPPTPVHTPSPPQPASSPAVAPQAPPVVTPQQTPRRAPPLGLPGGMLPPSRHQQLLRQPPPTPTPQRAAHSRPPEEQGVPWLLYAGLPADGTVTGQREIECFLNFISPTVSQQNERRTLRRAVQELAVSIDPLATAKVVGSVASGTDIFSSALDLVVECSTAAPAPARWVQLMGEAARERGLIAEPEGEEAPTKLRLRLPTHQTGAGAIVQFTGHDSQQRQCARWVNARLRAIPGAAAMARVLRGILYQMRLVSERGLADTKSACLTSHVVTLLIAAYFEYHGGVSDLPVALRDFCDFYGHFDFGSRSVRAAPPLPDDLDRMTLWESLFPKKMHEGPMSVVDPTAPRRNVAEHVTNLVGIQHGLKVVRDLASKWLDSTDFAKGKSLLFNVMSTKGLLHRYYDLCPAAPEVRWAQGDAAGEGGRRAPAAMHAAASSHCDS